MAEFENVAVNITTEQLVDMVSRGATKELLENSNKLLTSGGARSVIGDIEKLDSKNSENLVEAINKAAKSGGIYVGSGDMPVGYNIQIDPDGEEPLLVVSPEFAIVGQTIVVKDVDEQGRPRSWEAVNLPSSGGSSLELDTTLTQAGKAADAKAVGDALTALPSGGGATPKQWEHIATITVSPAEDGSLPVTISFTADSDGKPFELTDVYVDMQAATVSGGASGVYLQLRASNNNIGHVVANAKVGFYSSALRQCYVGYFNENGYGVGYATKSVNINTSFDGFEPHCELSKYVVIPNFAKVYKPITRVNLLDSGGSNLGWVAGSTFKLYGVRA